MTKTRFAMPIHQLPPNKLDTHKHHRRQNSDGTISTNNSDEEPQHYDDDTTINTKSTYGTMKSIDDTRTIGTATVGTFGTMKSGSTNGTGSFLCYTRDTAHELDLSYGDDNTSCAAFPKRMGTVVESLCTGVYDIFVCGTISEILNDVEKVCFPITNCYGGGDQSVVSTRGGGGQSVYSQDLQDGGQSVASQSQYSQPRRSKVRWRDHHRHTSPKVENGNDLMIIPAIRPEQSSEIAEKMDMLLRLLQEKETLGSGSVNSSKKENVAGDSKKKMKKDGDEVDNLEDDNAVNKMFNEATKKIMSAVGDFDGDDVKGLLAIETSFDDNDVSKVLGVDSAPEPIVSTIVANKTTKATKPVPTFSGDANDEAVSTKNANTTKKTSKSAPTAKKVTLVEPSQPQIVAPKASMLVQTTGNASTQEPVLQPWAPNAVAHDTVPQGTPLSVSTARTSNKAPRGRRSSVMKKLFGSSSKSHKKLSDNEENMDNWEQQPFVADFSSPSAFDSMGFPDTPVASDPFGSDWFSSPASSSSQHFFAGDGFSVGISVTGSSTVTQTETKICAWCKKGGSKTKKKLKLCSACQSTYYCR